MATITSRILPLREWDKAGGEDVPFHPVWHHSAPKTVARAERWSGGSDGWAAWAAHLGRRSDPRPVAELFAGKRPSLAWAMPVFAASPFADRPPTLELLSALDRLERQGRKWKGTADPVELAMKWATESAHRRGAAFGVECLAWCRALPALASLLPASLWWRLFATLLAICDEPELPAGDDCVSPQWLRAELPLTIAYLFPEITAARRLARGGARALLEGLAASVVEDGMPPAAILPAVRPLLATLARSRALARRLKKPCWSDAAEARYDAFAAQMLRLMRRDGTLALSVEPPDAADRDFFAVAFDGTSRSTRAAAQRAAPGCRQGVDLPEGRLPAPAANNEKTGVSVLRPGWARGGERLTVVRQGDVLRTELAVGRDVLWSGPWTCEIQRNGVPLAPQPGKGWEEACWSSTTDADFLEFELQLSDGMRVERQMLVAREDRFVFIADAIIGAEPAKLEYRSLLPLGEEIAFDASTESREGYLVGVKARGVAFPLALPEWRAEPCGGALEMTDSGLELRATREGVRCLYVPLLIDLDPRRLFRPATWRQLTVAEALRPVPADLAVGYRLQVRDKQWLVYRSLGERGNRTVLGQNLVSEFLVARFHASGEISPLLEIE